MANQVTITCDQLVDGHACGTPVPDNKSTTLSLNGVAWEADLCIQHRQPLANLVIEWGYLLRPLTTAYKPVSGNYRAKYHAGHKSFTARDVREWLREQGREVPESGRLKEAIMNEFMEAHRDAPNGSNGKVKARR